MPGGRFYEQCRRILAELDEAERSASELHNEPRGELRVIAPTNFGLTELGTAITDLVVAYPKLRVKLTVNDHVTDPIEAGYDIAISVGMPRGTSSSLIARKLNTARRILCAAPDYLARRGTPQIPEDLTQHDCLCYSYIAEPDEWHLIGADGERVVKVSGPIVTSHRHVLSTAAVRGLGIAYGPVDLFPRRHRCRPPAAGVAGLSASRGDDLRGLSGEPAAFRQGQSLQRFHGTAFRRQHDLSLKIFQSSRTFIRSNLRLSG